MNLKRMNWVFNDVKGLLDCHFLRIQDNTETAGTAGDSRKDDPNELHPHQKSLSYTTLRHLANRFLDLLFPVGGRGLKILLGEKVPTGGLLGDEEG